MRAIARHLHRSCEMIGLSKCGWLQLQQAPRLHLPLDKCRRRRFRRIGCGQNRTRQICGSQLLGFPAAAAILVDINYPIFAGTLGRDVLWRSALILDKPVTPCARRCKGKVLGRFPERDVLQFLFHKFQRTHRAGTLVSSVSQTHCVLHERAACRGLLTQIVRSGFRNNHLRFKRHLLDVLLTDVVKKAPNIAGPRSLISHRKSGLVERSVRQFAEKDDCIQQVGLTDSVGPGNTREWAKADIDVDQILKTGHAKTSQHGS